MQAQDIIRTCLSESDSSADYSTLSAAIRCASILLRVGFRFLSSCAFHTSTPPYPYDLKSSVSVPSVLEPESVGDVLNRDQLSAMQWVNFCVVAAACVVSPPESVASQVYDQYRKGSKSAAVDWSESPLPRILNLLANNSILHMDIVAEASVHLVFNCYALLNVASVDFSPVMKMCSPIAPPHEEQTVPSTALEACGTLIVLAHEELRSRCITKLLEIVSDGLVDAPQPLLLSAVLLHSSVWGHVLRAAGVDAVSGKSCWCVTC